MKQKISGHSRGHTNKDQHKPIECWFKQQGWLASHFQKNSWNAYLNGASGLIQVPTGSGKTYTIKGDNEFEKSQGIIQRSIK